MDQYSKQLVVHFHVSESKGRSSPLFLGRKTVSLLFSCFRSRCAAFWEDANVEEDMDGMMMGQKKGTLDDLNMNRLL